MARDGQPVGAAFLSSSTHLPGAAGWQKYRMTITSVPPTVPSIRIVRVAAAVQSALLAGAALLWAAGIVSSHRYDRSPDVRSDPGYPHGLGILVWGLLTAVTLGALALISVAAARMGRGRPRARRQLILAEVGTLVPVGALTVATLHAHYTGAATWLLITYDIAAVAVLGGLLAARRAQDSA
jgi:hypothetical protein